MLKLKFHKTISLRNFMHRVAKKRKKVLTIYTLYTFLTDKNFDICFTKDLIISTQIQDAIKTLLCKS